MEWGSVVVTREFLDQGTWLGFDIDMDPVLTPYLAMEPINLDFDQEKSENNFYGTKIAKHKIANVNKEK